MKNKTAFFVPVILIGFSYFMLSYNVESNKIKDRNMNSDKIEIPADVQLLIKDKCIGCHNTDSKNSKSKSKLNFDKFTNGEYSTGKMVSKLGKITKVLNKNDMPPEKFLVKYPNKKLTSDESDLLLNWANEQGKVLSGE